MSAIQGFLGRRSSQISGPSATLNGVAPHTSRQIILLVVCTHVTESKSELQRMLQEERGLADEETRERDGLYERAERLVSSLASIQDTLKDAIDDVNAGKLLSLNDQVSRACH